jgi:hypothetical protein
MHWIFVLVQKDSNVKKETLINYLPNLPLIQEKKKKKIKVFFSQQIYASLRSGRGNYLQWWVTLFFFAHLFVFFPKRQQDEGLVGNSHVRTGWSLVLV